MSTDVLPRRAALAAVTAVAALVAAGCGSSHGPGSASQAAASKQATVTIDLTPQGCQPKPAKIPAGQVQFDVANKDADAVTEAELRTSDLAHILGEQENLTPGLSGGFSLNIRPGSYKINCPGAAQPHWTFTVTGKATGPAWQSNPQLAAAVRGYGDYITGNTGKLVSRTRKFCRAIDGGQLSKAKQLYPRARVYYEHIEPVAEVWGSLDTAIDGRWENPVTVASKFTGFHKLEQLLWRDDTLHGAARLCAGLVENQQQLRALVGKAQYNPLEMASGATDLINEAATSKITGEEERYSNTDLPVFQANVDGAMKVVSLLQPYLNSRDPGLVAQIKQREAAVARLMGHYRAKPGYDHTGYVSYASVSKAQRRQLSTAVNAFAEALSQVPGKVG